MIIKRARWERWKTDAYGYIHNGQLRRMRRHPKCRCKIPCQMRFLCSSRHHVGSRSTPWCNGTDADEMCDTCFAKREAKRVT